LDLFWGFFPLESEFFLSISSWASRLSAYLLRFALFHLYSISFWASSSWIILSWVPLSELSASASFPPRNLSLGILPCRNRIPQSLNEMTNEIVDCLVHLCHWGLRHLLRLIKVSSSASVYASSSADPDTVKSDGTYLDSALTMKAYIRLITSYMNKINTINGPKSSWNWQKTYYNNCESLVMVAQVQLKSFNFGYGNPIYLASTPKLL